MVDFGDRLKILRLKQKMTQDQLAERLGLTKSAISAYETNLRMPSYESLMAIARIFKVSTDYLLGLENRWLIDLSGLTNSEKDALMSLIKVMKRKI